MSIDMDEHTLQEEEIKNCFDRLREKDSKYHDQEQLISSFRKYPNGFYINEHTNASDFLIHTITEKTKRDKLSVLVSQVDLIKKLGTRSLSLSIPDNILHPKEKIDAIKFVNESILIWTDQYVYKLPSSIKAIERIENERINSYLLMAVDERIRTKFLVPSFISHNGMLIQYSKRCNVLELTQKNIRRVDEFLHNYFALVFFLSKKRNDLYVGLQHGDFHYRNIFIDEHNELHIADIDMLDENGYPFLDIFHFTVHLVRTKEKSRQYSPLETHLSDASYLYNKLGHYGFNKLAELWMKYYNKKYIDLYIQSQIEWYQTNQIINDELEQILGIRNR